MPARKSDKIRPSKIGRTIYDNDSVKLTCSRCNHTWTKRGKSLPERCPNLKCKSPYWNNERVRDTNDATWLVPRSWSETYSKHKITKYTVEDTELTCQCCGYTWTKRYANKLPQLCPKCRNSNWNYVRELENTDTSKIKTT